MPIFLNGPVESNLNNYPMAVDTYVGYNPDRGIIICPECQVKEITWYEEPQVQGFGRPDSDDEEAYVEYEFKGSIRVEHEEGEEVIEFTDLILFNHIKNPIVL